MNIYTCVCICFDSGERQRQRDRDSGNRLCVCVCVCVCVCACAYYVCKYTRTFMQIHVHTFPVHIETRHLNLGLESQEILGSETQ